MKAEEMSEVLMECARIADYFAAENDKLPQGNMITLTLNGVKYRIKVEKLDEEEGPRTND